LEGIVYRSTGSWYEVRRADGDLWHCRIKGKMRLDDLPTTNPIAVGDTVVFEAEAGDEKHGIIRKVSPRQNYVVRQSTRQRNHLHLIAANIDQALLVVTLRHPNIKLGFIDRFLLTTATYNIPTTIIFNKADIYEEEDLNQLADIYAIYKKIGYGALLVSATTGKNIDKLRDLLKDKTSLLSGHSGVGKSSLLNTIDADLKIRTQEISDYSEKGMHTTTFAEMFDLKSGGRLIDTPGIKELGFIHLSPQDVAHNFKEIFETAHNCKYKDCRHVGEPTATCAVKTAVQSGEISLSRYQNYLNIYQEVEEQNSWEQKKEW
jgi:ribosome biogenesis GTPase / thiamine phosphate phosphatase